MTNAINEMKKRYDINRMTFFWLIKKPEEAKNVLTELI